MKLLIPALVAGVLLVLWAAHDGGYDEDTWYWGALLLLALLVGLVGARPKAFLALGRPLQVALIAFALYVGWSFLSILWAQSPGDALKGSNRALLYLILCALFALTPWTGRRMLGLLLAYTISIGVLGVLIFVDMTSAHHVQSLFSEGRLVSPTGYFNSTAALFTIAAFLATSLSARRELPSQLRGLLIGIACGSAQLALLGESRGWLFTLPVMLAAGVLVSRDRLRVSAAAAFPIVATLLPLHALLGVFRAAEAAHPRRGALAAAASHAAKESLLVCVVMIAVGALLASLDHRRGRVSVSPAVRRTVGTALVVLALLAGVAGGAIATHGHPVAFINRQWNGFTHEDTGRESSTSHFATIGSGRYDAWRVSLDAFLAHPIGGLGQDNFADYYDLHRHTTEELSYTHSFELRLLAHTGLVGTLLFATFLIGALVAALRARLESPALRSGLCAACLLPLVVWLIHGSVDWFWEMPALSGPALGFLMIAGAGARRGRQEAPVVSTGLLARVPRLAWVAAGALVVCSAVVALGLPYLSVREVSLASDARAHHPSAALARLATAADLNPLSADPGRIGGTIALQNGQFTAAQTRFRQAITREPESWFAWFGEGLAESALGNNQQAYADLRQAYRINSAQPGIGQALSRVNSLHPLTPQHALQLLLLAH